MKFEQLHVAGFGRLSNLDIDFAPGLTIVAGPNEAGKSTVVECLLRLLFGFPEPRYNKERNRFAPWSSGVPYAATLRYRLDDGRVFEVSRDFANAEVRTETVEADTRRPVPALTGNKSTSPGESAFHFSLEVYKVAAVISAGDFAEEANGAVPALADRLAAVVGAAGDASAAQAIERLKKVHSEVGLSGANTPLGKAARDAEDAATALRRFRDDLDGFADNMRRQTELVDRVHDLSSRRGRCAAALAVVRLRSIRARITEAGDAQKLLADAAARRSAVIRASPALLARRDEIDAAAEAVRLALGSADEAGKRASGRAGERDAMQHEVDAASAALLEKRAAVTRFDETIAAHEAAASGRPAISTAMLAELEREADEVDATEGRARTLDTEAAIARQRSRPSAFPMLAALTAFVALAASWIPTHSTVVAILAAAAGVLGGALAGAYGAATRRRADAISSAESVAAEAAESSGRAAAALSARCRSLGCANVAAVRAARTAQAELDRVRAQRAAAAEAATLLGAQCDALQRRLADFQALDVDRTISQSRVEELRAALAALLDEISIAPGSIDDRLAEYHRLLDAGENAALADAAVAHARTALERALQGQTVDSLCEDATRYAADAAAGGDPGEFSDRNETDLDMELKLLDAQHREAERMLEGAQARLSEFDRGHPVPAAELEERAAAAAVRRDHLRAVRAAAQTAWEAIEKVKDDVHRDFTPLLNEAVGQSAAAMTGGRYEQAWIDPADFTVRVRIPETGKSLEADFLSTGTIEQFQFALRAALALALGSGEHVPILYDDALAHADDDRLKAALERAAALANDGDQIVFFTQRGMVEDLAGRLPGVKLVRLLGPAG